MYNLLFLLIVKLAAADMAPPPSCPDGESTTYVRGYRCVKNGYELVDLTDFDIPREIVKKIEAGELLIPGAASIKMTIERGAIEVQEKDQKKLVEILKNLDTSKLKKPPKPSKAPKKEEPSPTETKQEAEPVPLKNPSTEPASKSDAIPKTKTDASTDAVDSTGCTSIAVAQNLVLLSIGFLFSIFRRKF